jgi:hypothetical protein
MNQRYCHFNEIKCLPYGFLYWVIDFSQKFFERKYQCEVTTTQFVTTIVLVIRLVAL